MRTKAYTYQPDVVFVEGGPGAIVSASPDGVVWTVDAGADGADDVEVGKVMYVTSRAVGRVARVERSSEGLQVVLAPVELTEVFRDADLSFDRAVTPEMGAYLRIPELPGM